VTAAIDHAKQPQQAQLAQCAHEANVEQSVIHAGAVREAHAVPILRPITGGDQEAVLLDARLPVR
jgi:hypothetical protein